MIVLHGCRLLSLLSVPCGPAHGAHAQAVADRGLKPHEWTSARLHSTVLYLESHK